MFHQQSLWKGKYPLIILVLQYDYIQFWSKNWDTISENEEDEHNQEGANDNEEHHQECIIESDTETDEDQGTRSGQIQFPCEATWSDHWLSIVNIVEEGQSILQRSILLI